MGEVLYVHYLLLHPNEQALRRVLGWSSPPVDIPPELVDGLRFQFINIGVGMALIPFQVGTLIETGEQWKELEPVERDRLLDDPWAFKEFLFSRRFTSQLLANNQNTGGLERHLLLHIAFPDTFERILQNDKNRIAGASRFARFVGEETDDVGPVAKVVDLFPFRYLPSCLDVGQPVCLLLLPADPLDPVAALIQGVFPHHAVSPWHEWKVDRYGYAQAVLWADYTGPWASVGPRVEGLGVVPVPPPEDRVSLHLVVPWHCCAPRFTRSILAGAFGKALSAMASA
jgi:hypothetical protein